MHLQRRRQMRKETEKRLETGKPSWKEKHLRTKKLWWKEKHLETKRQLQK
jgi:hypothetical protein